MRGLAVFMWLALLLDTSPISPATAQDGGGCAKVPVKSSELAGHYLDNWGSFQIITKDFWVEGDLIREICQVDDVNRVVIAYNHPRDQYNPAKFSRFDWVRYDGRLWFCHTVFDAATETDALSAPAANASDPRTGGCGKFSWTSIAKFPQ